MPIGTNPFANLGNLIKATATGIIQTVTGSKNTQTKNNADDIRETEADAQSHDGVALSKEAQGESSKAQGAKPSPQQAQTEQTQLETPQMPQQNDRGEAGLVQGRQDSPLSRPEETAGSAIAQRAQGAQAAEPQPEVPEQIYLPQAGQAQERPAAVELQQLLQGWLQLDPKTITGLEKFLEVEFSHYPEDYQLFLNMRMMNMLKQARRLIEEQKLGGTEEEQQASPDTPEGSKRAMIGAALMGYSYYKVLRKRARIKDRFGFAAADKKSLEAGEGGVLHGPFASLQEADRFLKEAEKELQRAMLQGLDNERIRHLAGKVLDICSQIAEMQVGTPSSARTSERRQKEPVG